MTEAELRAYLAPNSIEEYELAELSEGEYCIVHLASNSVLIIEDNNEWREVIAALKAAGVRVVPV